MRKRIITPVQQETASLDQDWLKMEGLAEVEITSEDAGHPIESALLPGRASGWRAAGPGKQTIRLLFANPQRLRRIRLNFVEPRTERTQEYVLRWSPDGGQSYRKIVRQQWNFSPQGATSETEDLHVELSAGTAFKDPLSLTIDDPLHSSDEERLILIGMSYNMRMLVIIHTESGDNIRIISARKTTKKERNYYETNV